MELFSSWTGSDFLLFYSTLLALACAAAWWIPAHLREAGRGTAPDDFESIALLSGGKERLADSLLADLLVRGALSPADKGKLAIAEPRLASSPAGQALLAANAPMTIERARAAIAVHADRVAARLQRGGLLLRPEAHNRLRWLSIAPFMALFVIGLYRQRAGSALGEPTEFLTLLLCLTLVLAIVRFARSDPRTTAGVEAVKRLRSANKRASRAPRPEEAALAVALFGTGVLVGTPWEPVHAMRQQGGGDGGGSSDGGGDGGSGCGGGGCGGCGG